MSKHEAAELEALVQRQFGPAAGDYLSSDVHAKGESLDWMVKMAMPKPTWKTVDIACGAGHAAVRFAPLVKDVVAVDVTPEMLAVAKQNADAHGLKNIAFVAANVDRLPFPDDTFDLACCRLAAHHFADMSTAFAEIHRVVAPGGAFLFVDNFTLPESEAAKFHNDFEQLRDPSHRLLVDLVALERLLEQAGFAVVEMAEVAKPTELESWASRQGCSADVKRHLVQMLADAPKSLQMLLDPKPVGDGWQFTIREAVFHCRKKK